MKSAGMVTAGFSSGPAGPVTVVAAFAPVH